jgi:hypothetical protein
VNAIEGLTEEKGAGGDERRATHRRPPAIESVTSLMQGAHNPRPGGLQGRPHMLD